MHSTPTFRTAFAAAGILALAVTTRSDAALFSYYIGVDGLETIASGEFAGQPNPNHGRLTLLYAHHYTDTPASNHYHSKGIYRYQPGSGPSPVVELNPSNYLPEGSNPPLEMVAGSGLYDGKLVAEQDPGNGFSLITIKGTDELDGFTAGTGEHYLFNSSAGRWTGSLAGSDIHLVLVSMSSGLNIGNATSLSIGLLSPDDELHLGETPDFSPVFWMDAGAAPGTYTAQFRLADEEGTFGDSGTFEFRFQVAAVPEPSSAMLVAAAMGFGLLRRRR